MLRLKRVSPLPLPCAKNDLILTNKIGSVIPADEPCRSSANPHQARKTTVKATYMQRNMNAPDSKPMPSSGDLAPCLDVHILPLLK